VKEAYKALFTDVIKIFLTNHDLYIPTKEIATDKRLQKAVDTQKTKSCTKSKRMKSKLSNYARFI
jgi:hypothetical protein